MAIPSPLICDVLHSHPPINPYESLTSYCIRIGQKNQIGSVKGIAQLLFPETDGRQIHDLNDLPPLRIATMAKATHRLEEKILESTFYYMGVNFGRSTQPQALSRFLKGALSPFLRYCPICLKENPYYSLLWRFNHIAGCEKHGCKLLNYCPHCGDPLPLFVAPFKIGTCAKCYGNLVDGNIIFISDEIHKNDISSYEDLKLFLSNTNYPKNLFVGNLLKIYRIYKGIPVYQIAKNLKKSSEYVTNAESAIGSKGSFNFSEHLEYLRILGSSFHEIISIPFIQDDLMMSVIIPIDKVRSKSANLRNDTKTLDEEIRDTNVDAISVSSKKARFQRIKERISYEELRIRVIKAIEELQKKGEEPLVRKVAKEAGVSRNYLYHYPELRQLFPTKNDTLYEKHYQNESNILEKVNLASESLLNQSGFITYSMVSKAINTPLDTILYYFRVRDRIDQLISQQLIFIENGLLAKLETFVNTDVFKNTPYVRTILNHLQLSDFLIKRYPRLQAKIHEFTKQTKKRKHPIKKDSYTIQNKVGKDVSVIIKQPETK